MRRGRSLNVFDASALLVFLGEEQGSDSVEDALIEGGVVGAANWSEVAQKVLECGRD
jgi:PIN domain nuclease of toxin-antitoxin system